MNREDWKKLHWHEKQDKVLKWLGWKIITPVSIDDSGVFIDPNGHQHEIAPDIDLNFMHDSVANIFGDNFELWSRYCDYLLEISGENMGGAFEATAEQRSEAFVLTMENYYEKQTVRKAFVG